MAAYEVGLVFARDLGIPGVRAGLLVAVALADRDVTADLVVDNPCFNIVAQQATVFFCAVSINMDGPDSIPVHHVSRCNAADSQHASKLSSARFLGSWRKKAAKKKDGRRPQPRRRFRKVGLHPAGTAARAPFVTRRGFLVFILSRGERLADGLSSLTGHPSGAITRACGDRPNNSPGQEGSANSKSRTGSIAGFGAMVIQPSPNLSCVRIFNDEIVGRA